MSTTLAPSNLEWDVSSVFTGLDSPDFEQALAKQVDDLESLRRLFDHHQVGGEAVVTDERAVTAFDEVTRELNRISEEAETLGAYVYAFVSTNSRNDLAQARLSTLETRGVELAKLVVRYTAWIGALDLPTLQAQSGVAQEHAYPLEVLQIDARHQMSAAEENLAAELAPSGSSAWTRLYDTATSQIMVPMTQDGQETELPISAVRNLAYVPDREVRRTAYEAELDAWERHTVPLVAALNGIKGEVNTLTEKRGWDDPLDAALHGNRIDRPTLDAMLGAAREAFPEFRRYLRLKATYLGLDKLAWFDLFAPLGSAGDEEEKEKYSYANATRFVADCFERYSPRLRDLAERAVQERWIDVEPRAGKTDGAFCMWIRGDESRVLLNFQPSYNGLSTMAHELGHAYHNLNEAGLSTLQRQTPMTLAETASIFCETIVRDAALASASEVEQLAILEASLQGATQVVVDITSRFLFEQRVFAARKERDLSIEECKQLMLQGQQETYGDGLDPNLLHPYMWAAKGHYYSTMSYYNYPYMFGLLFGLGLYAEYQKNAEGFQERYDDLLANTGRASASDLAARFGIDIRSIDFWRGSLGVIKNDIDRFATLVEGATTGR